MKNTIKQTRAVNAAFNTLADAIDAYLGTCRKNKSPVKAVFVTANNTITNRRIVVRYAGDR